MPPEKRLMKILTRETALDILARAAKTKNPAKSLLAAGLNAQELNRLGINPAIDLHIKFALDVLQLRRLGYTPDYLIHFFPASEIVDAGFKQHQLSRAGITRGQVDVYKNSVTMGVDPASRTYWKLSKKPVPQSLMNALNKRKRKLLP